MSQTFVLSLSEAHTPNWHPSVDTAHLLRCLGGAEQWSDVTQTAEKSRMGSWQSDLIACFDMR